MILSPTLLRLFALAISITLTHVGHPQLDAEYTPIQPFGRSFDQL